ncbi:DNA binding domain, excisionase family (plasmid) [Tsukamurella tyrosinosolvens]|uniref:DNA binding domain-containing protein, excisionase family n=1 Tax=Tsukamurella tyrosinosolvens TaxID=57704 RepID=A0A1H4VGF6_TSUTY|nr:helix-turn-helix domain-containing protein [Tsukamurella tyrosinosolvens]SEC79960.1 DNA binding domain-containing protein, excisionase family [Tsukamurella tyrosinosolvens]VEH90540.1 DNA binding domain, excisionase family [Tsukamurella tyrosinosolvens]
MNDLAAAPEASPSPGLDFDFDAVMAKLTANLSDAERAAIFEFADTAVDEIAPASVLPTPPQVTERELVERSALTNPNPRPGSADDERVRGILAISGSDPFYRANAPKPFPVLDTAALRKLRPELEGKFNGQHQAHENRFSFPKGYVKNYPELFPGLDVGVRLLTIREAAAEMAVSQTEVHAQIFALKLWAFRVGRTIRIRSDHVERWVAGDREMKIPEPRVKASNGLDLGMPVDDFAKIVRVHPRTVMRWHNDPELRFTLAGLNGSRVVTADELSYYRIPFDPKRLVPVTRRAPSRELLDLHVGHDPQMHADLSARFNNEERKDRAIQASLEGKIDRRDTAVVDDLGRLTIDVKGASVLMNLTVSGARKALQRDGVRGMIRAGSLRVAVDDVLDLCGRRKLKRDRKINPNAQRYQPDSAPYYPLAEAAERLGVSERTVRRWAAKGKIAMEIRDGAMVVPGIEISRHGGVVERYVRDLAKRREIDRAALKGAHLTPVDNARYQEWQLEDTPELDPAEFFCSRNRAAAIAGCRPSVIEDLVQRGYIPALRQGRDLTIRTVDLHAAASFSALVGRMCPKVRPKTKQDKWNAEGEYLTIDNAAMMLRRPASEVRRLIAEGLLTSLRFGHVHRIHISSVVGEPKRVLNRTAPYRPLSQWRDPTRSGRATIAEAAGIIGVTERTVQRWCAAGLLTSFPAIKQLWSPQRQFYNRVKNRGALLMLVDDARALRRLRQVRGLAPRTRLVVPQSFLDEGRELPELKPWQEYVLNPDA